MVNSEWGIRASAGKEQRRKEHLLLTDHNGQHPNYQIFKLSN